MVGKTILITRSKGDETQLSDELHALGFPVIHEPMTDIFLLHTARPQLDAAILRDPDAVIVTSRHGVHALAALSHVRDLALICVGESTADTAFSLGFTRVSNSGGDMDKLIAFVTGAYDAEARFLYVSAEHVHGDMAAELGIHGMQVERVVVYEAVAAERFSDVLVEQIRRGHLDGVTFMSQRAAKIFMRLMDNAGLMNHLSSLQAFCLSDVVAEPLLGCGWEAIHIAREPTLASLVECVDNAHTRKT